MNAENLQITQMQDSIVLRSQPMVRKPKSQVLAVIVDSAPLTIYEVKTARGKIAFKVETRTKKYIERKELASIVRKGLAYLYPRNEQTKRKHQARKSQWWREHREEINTRRRARYAMRKQA